MEFKITTIADLRNFIETDAYQNHLQEFIQNYRIKMSDMELSLQAYNILADALKVAKVDLRAIEQKLNTDKDFIFVYGRVVTDKYEQEDKDFGGHSETCLIYFTLVTLFLEESEQALANHYKNRKFKGYTKLAKEQFAMYNEAKQLYEQKR